MHETAYQKYNLIQKVHKKNQNIEKKRKTKRGKGRRARSPRLLLWSTLPLCMNNLPPYLDYAKIL
jgi:hypothetical protein